MAHELNPGDFRDGDVNGDPVMCDIAFAVPRHVLRALRDEIRDRRQGDAIAGFLNMLDGILSRPIVLGVMQHGVATAAETMALSPVEDENTDPRLPWN